MYKEKTIINFTGKTCCGKSYLSSLLDKNKVEVIEIDKYVEANDKRIYTEKERKLIKKSVYKYGVKALSKIEKLSASSIARSILDDIEMSDKEIIIIDGVQGYKMFNKIIDTVITFKTKYKAREKYCKLKGWKMSKFRSINKFQKERGIV